MSSSVVSSSSYPLLTLERSIPKSDKYETIGIEIAAPKIACAKLKGNSDAATPTG